MFLNVCKVIWFGYFVRTGPAQLRLILIKDFRLGLGFGPHVRIHHLHFRQLAKLSLVSLRLNEWAKLSKFINTQKVEKQVI